MDGGQNWLAGNPSRFIRPWPSVRFSQLLAITSKMHTVREFAAVIKAAGHPDWAAGGGQPSIHGLPDGLSPIILDRAPNKVSDRISDIG